MAQQEVQQLQQQLAAVQHAVGSADLLQQDKSTLQVSQRECQSSGCSQKGKPWSVICGMLSVPNQA